MIVPVVPSQSGMLIKSHAQSLWKGPRVRVLLSSAAFVFAGLMAFPFNPCGGKPGICLDASFAQSK